MINEKTKTFDKNLIEHLLEQERRENTQQVRDFLFLYFNYSLKNIFFQDANQLEKNILLFNESLYANTIKWNNELKSLRVRFYIIKFDYFVFLS
jgi:hypothetical protein